MEVLAEEVEAGGDFVEGFVAAAFAEAKFRPGPQPAAIHIITEKNIRKRL